jgi:pimeloyl-ACP methyl ester carboxylesterase
MRLAALITFLLGAIPSAIGAVLSVTWPTTHAAQPLQLPAPASEFLPAFRLSLIALPESSVVPMALTQPAFLGLTTEQTRKLQPLIIQRYQLMAQSPDYAKAPSALAYCFSDHTPTNGFATVYVSPTATTKSPVILFLHGYGGSFLWYQHYLSETFSNYIIVCPAYGMSPATIPQSYIAESLRAASNRLGFPLSTPSLLGLSAGGFGACRVYTANPHFYSQLICLGAYPPDETLSRFSKSSRPRFLSGGLEDYVVSGDLTRRIGRIRRDCNVVEEVIVPGADHFFPLTHKSETLKQLHNWLTR